MGHDVGSVLSSLTPNLWETYLLADLWAVLTVPYLFLLEWGVSDKIKVPPHDPWLRLIERRDGRGRLQVRNFDTRNLSLGLESLLLRLLLLPCCTQTLLLLLMTSVVAKMWFCHARGHEVQPPTEVALRLPANLMWCLNHTCEQMPSLHYEIFGQFHARYGMFVLPLSIWQCWHLAMYQVSTTNAIFGTPNIKHMMADFATTNMLLQTWNKRWRLGCVIPASWLPLAAGNELSQSSLRLLFYVNFMYRADGVDGPP